MSFSKPGVIFLKCSVFIVSWAQNLLTCYFVFEGVFSSILLANATLLFSSIHTRVIQLYILKIGLIGTHITLIIYCGSDFISYLLSTQITAHLQILLLYLLGENFTITGILHLHCISNSNSTWVTIFFGTCFGTRLSLHRYSLGGGVFLQSPGLF